MKKILTVSMILVSLMPLSATADDPGSSTAPSPVVTLPAASTKAGSVEASPKTSTASNSESTKLSTSLASIRKLIDAKSFSAALAALKIADKDFPNNADLNNLLGFASRNLKQYAASDKYYAKALKLNPNHLGALEYQGELFIKLKKLALAKANLAKLKKLCGSTCEEYQDLLKAIGSK